MKVQELIEALTKCPPDYEITVILDEMPDTNATEEEVAANPPHR
jgi:hypothetical protein